MFQCIGSSISYIQRIGDWDNDVYMLTGLQGGIFWLFGESYVIL